MSQEDKFCNGTTKVHADAMAIVEYLFEHGGGVAHTQDEIAYKTDMMIRQHGVYVPNKSRFRRAREHLLKRYVDADGKPCCSYRIHYRKAGPNGSTLELLDPTGTSLAGHARAAVSTLLGWMSRERQHHTENQNQINVFETLGDFALAHNDKVGFRLCQKAMGELDDKGTVTPGTMGQLQVWAQAIQL